MIGFEDAVALWTGTGGAGVPALVAFMAAGILLFVQTLKVYKFELLSANQVAIIVSAIMGVFFVASMFFPVVAAIGAAIYWTAMASAIAGLTYEYAGSKLLEALGWKTSSNDFLEE